MKVLAILGPTASGKSALAIRAAREFGGEIVSADSRQVYRGMDVGTAKPTAAERALAPHHMLDVAEPSERYDAARYRREAGAVLADLAARGVRPIVVGGTGLYVRALLDGLDLEAVPADPELRARLEDEAARVG
ncbi:MAG: tRNA (adenosine(37)-N6)-dimethylallyltransferase, partial [Candidatus Limnocylindria bacterium]